MIEDSPADIIDHVLARTSNKIRVRVQKKTADEKDKNHAQAEGGQQSEFIIANQ